MNTTTSASSTSDTTLLTEHLTYRPIALIDDIVNSINELSFKAINAIEKGLLAAPPSAIGFPLPPMPSISNPNTPERQRIADRELEAVTEKILTACKHEIENGTHQFETLFETKIDKNFDKLEIYALRNILSIPVEVRDWIRLAHYEGLNLVAVDLDSSNSNSNGTGNESTGGEEYITAETITSQRSKWREMRKLKALLTREKLRNEDTIRALKLLIHGETTSTVKTESSSTTTTTAHPNFAFLAPPSNSSTSTIGTSTAQPPLTTHTSFTLSQLPALSSILDNLEPRLQALQSTQPPAPSEAGEWTQTRHDFIETQTRRHLEEQRGLELDAQGGVRDGEWQGAGRRLGEGEVGALEGVLGMIGGAGGAGGKGEGKEGGGEEMDERA